VFKSSITKFLIASLGILMAGLFLAVLILVVQAWTNYSMAGRIARLTNTDHILFDAVIRERAQVPKISTALMEEDDPHVIIDSTRHEAAKTIGQAVAALKETNIADADAFADAIRIAWKKELMLQPTIDAMAANERSERTLHAVDGWRDAIHGVTDAINTASVAVGNTIRMGDPVIAELVQIRRTAWTIRDRYGLQCSMLRYNVGASARLSSALLASWMGNRAVYVSAWLTLDEILMRPGVSSELRQRIKMARTETELAQAKVDAIVSHFDDSGRPTVAGAQWTAMCDGPFDSVLSIAQQAQEEASRHAEAIRAASSQMLLVAGLALSAVVGFGVFAVITVKHRLARPMKSLSVAIARLSRRDFDQAVPTTGSPDELGDMAQALESLRASALEAERLQLMMSRFTADASHQMRTPLTILRTHISVLGGLIPCDTHAHSSLKDIQEAADRLQRLLIQLLKLAHADGGQSVEKEIVTTDLRQAIQEIAGKHVPQAMEANVDLHFEAEHRVFPTSANPITINEVLSNLIDNAIRYNKSGGSVVIKLFDEHGKHRIDVEDDGPGIPLAEREKVFTRFYRLSRDQHQVGSGLGLAIVQSLAATLNATIEVSEGVNHLGLRVRVSFN
jgi:signal transduction histidine kinase